MDNQIKPSLPSSSINWQKIFIILVIELSALILLVFVVFIAEKNKENQNILPQKTTKPLVEDMSDPRTKDWLSFKNDMLGLEIKYPQNVALDINMPTGEKYSLIIRIKDLNNYNQDPMGYDLSTALFDQHSLKNREYGSKIFGQNYPNSRELAVVGNTYGKKYLSLQEFDVCDVQFTRVLIFYKNDHQITLFFRAPTSLAKELPAYFTYDSQNCGQSPLWKDGEKFHQDLLSKTAPQPALDWYYLFDQIVENIRFTD